MKNWKRKTLLFTIILALIVGYCKKDYIKIQSNKIYTNYILNDSLSYHNALDFTVYGSLTNDYRRLNDIPNLKHFSRTSTGISIAFKTNSSSIALKWENKNINPAGNMSLLNKAGVDLYVYENNNFTYVSSIMPQNEYFTYKKVLRDMGNSDRIFLLNLPTYAEIDNLEIGINEGAFIEKVEVLDKNKKIVIYGSSITQGASSSRPGLNYPNLVSRSLKREVVNVGFSGLGIFDLKLLPVLADIEADEIILESIPNAKLENVKEYAFLFIEGLLKKGKKVYIVEGFIREDSYLNYNDSDLRSKTSTEARNKLLYDIYTDLQQQGYNIVWIDNSCFESVHGFTADGIHLNDIGHKIQAEHILSFFKDTVNQSDL